MARKKRKLVSMDPDLHKELRTNFPNTNMRDLINVMYRTSLLKAENALRKKNKKK